MRTQSAPSLGHSTEERARGRGIAMDKALVSEWVMRERAVRRPLSHAWLPSVNLRSVVNCHPIYPCHGFGVPNLRLAFDAELICQSPNRRRRRSSPASDEIWTETRYLKLIPQLWETLGRLADLPLIGCSRKFHGRRYRSACSDGFFSSCGPVNGSARFG